MQIKDELARRRKKEERGDQDTEGAIKIDRSWDRGFPPPCLKCDAVGGLKLTSQSGLTGLLGLFSTPRRQVHR